MPIAEINVLHGKRIRVTMKKENIVSSRHFSVYDQAKAEKYIETKERKGWKLKW